MDVKIGIVATIFMLLLLLSRVYGQQEEEEEEVCVKINDGSCDPFQGNWVYDESYPPYDISICRNWVFQLPIQSQQFDCLANNNHNKDYTKYRWQPTGCDLPRFDAVDLLFRLRSKNIGFVGELIGLNQWQSLLCMFQAAEPYLSMGANNDGGYRALNITNYNATFAFYTSPFLVKYVNPRDPSDPSDNKERILFLDSIDGTAVTSPSPGSQPPLLPWKSMDVLIFNSWHSWQYWGTDSNKLWDSIVEGDKKLTDIDPMVAFEKGLTTWANWIDSNIDASKTTVFFQGISPHHMDTCTGETKPTTSVKSWERVEAGQRVLEKVLGKMSTPVYLLNITSLSQQRPDAHPQASPQGPDCALWCNFGVPDTWNQLLYAFLLQLQS